jgi:alpha-1,6-mannosyltransferase
LLAATAVLSALLLLGPESSGHWRATAVLVLSLASLTVLTLAERRDPRLDRRVVLAACAVVLLLAVATPLRRSHDVWSYAVLGRMVGVHDGNPYVNSPSDFPDDPYYERISPQWRHGATVYGPVWVAISVALTDATGTSFTATRLAFQGLAALSVGLALLIVDRATRDPVAVALVGLNPMTVLYLVNGGHSDAIIGLALVAAAVAARRRPVLAGVLVGVAALVKLVALLALVALTAWLWTHRGVRAAVRGVAAGAGTVVAGYVVYGRTAAVRALHGAQDSVSAPSIWRPLRDRLIAEGHRSTDTGIGVPALILVVVVAAVVIVARRRDAGPESGMAAALFVYVAAASYTLIWYLAWLVPLVALRPRSRLATLVTIYTVVALVTAEHPAGPSRDSLDQVLDHADDLLRVVAVIGLLALIFGRFLDRGRYRDADARSAPPAHGPRPS